jgi:hypothetical protein
MMAEAAFAVPLNMLALAADVSISPGFRRADEVDAVNAVLWPRLSLISAKLRARPRARTLLRRRVP